MPRTYVSYESLLKKRILPHFGKAQVRRIQHDDVQQFVDGLTARYAPNSVRRTFVVLNRVMASAVKRQLVAANPCAEIDLPRATKGEMRFLTAEQVEQLAEAVNGQYRLLVRFAAYTGLRAGELVALRVKDLNLPAGPVFVSRSVADVNGTLIEGTTKTSKTRRVGIPSSLLPDLRDHLASCHPDGYTGEALVFPGEQGGSLRHGNFMRRHFKPAVQQLVDQGAWPAALAGLRFHDLRHTCAALLIDSGANPKDIADRLGHSSISVKMDTYGHRFESHDVALTEALDQRLRTLLV